MMTIRQTFSTVLCVSLLAGSTSSQTLVDLQPGRNFPTATSEFGAGHSENLDVGDCDHDGDYDVAVANGGDAGSQLNTLYINRGGSQGGTPGTFSDQSATRFAGLPSDRSRDIEFVDFDSDCDLDIFVANSGTTVDGGQVSRAYVNQGGLQLGAIGFYAEGTDAFWGTLAAVPVTAQVFGNGTGPFRDYSCDCDFGDLDLDGDIDLFHSSYGPNTSGTFDSRVFLNDGTGRFDELWPWVNAGGDIKLHTVDIDLVDLDGDFDLDVFASSINSQSRVYRNNWHPGGATDPFTDVTQTALIDTGASQAGNRCYETEFGDLDGDGDFDIYALNYNNLAERVLENTGNITFAAQNWVNNDPVTDESEADLLDFDGDGDLDVFIANFSGTNYLFANSTAQGPPAPQLLHRTGTPSGQYPAPELPSSGNGGTTLDADCADMDGDGDTDILLANGSNQANAYFKNKRGIPDTHAPSVHIMTAQGDKGDGSDTPIRAQLRDNASYYIVNYYGVDLLYSVDGGVENRLPMSAQGSMQFQASIPGELSGTIAYRVVGSDDAGNAFASAVVTYNQTSSGTPAILSVDTGTAGVAGNPYLFVKGSLAVGSPLPFTLCDAAPDALAVLMLSLDSNPVSFKGGLLYPVPLAIIKTVPTTGPGGLLTLPFSWVPGIAPGQEIWCQYGVQDAVAQDGASLSNAVVITTP